jgi:hypothetical protein
MACSVMFMEEFFHALKLSLWAGVSSKAALVVQFLIIYSKALVAYERL